MTSAPPSAAFAVAAADHCPLVVDLDGTLIRTDLLVESGFQHLGEHPLRILGLFGAVMQGKAALKARIADVTTIDAAHLPYNEDVLAVIAEAKAAGRKVYLASASNERYVQAVAEHLDVFDGWFASTASVNLSSQKKADRLVAEFGAGQFDYIGNDAADLAVWAVARRRLAVGAPADVRAKLMAIDPAARLMPVASATLRTWVKLLRVHQWSKNALVAVPMLTAQRFGLVSIVEVIAAFLAFSLAASSIYIINDLVDLGADRVHRSKRNRPMAAGTVPVLHGMVAAPVLLGLAFAIGFAAAPWFNVVLAVYLLLTTAYTFSLKRKMFIDVVALAGLYTIRVIGGAAAIDVPVSEWLLAFSLFVFSALALVKRYVELANLVDANLPDPSNRNYQKADLNIVGALAAAAAFNAITVFSLYISSETVHALYRHPRALWLICPILMYWLGRMLIMANRRMIDDDPVVFALRDRTSLVTFGLIGFIMLAAI